MGWKNLFFGSILSVNDDKVYDNVPYEKLGCLSKYLCVCVFVIKLSSFFISTNSVTRKERVPMIHDSNFFL